MDQQEVLGQVAGTRARVAQAITQIEGRRDEAQEILSRAGAHLAELKGAFDQFQSHLQSEEARCAVALQHVVEALHSCGRTLHAEADRRGQDAHTFGNDLEAQHTSLDADREDVHVLSGTINAQGEVRRTIKAELTQSVDEHGHSHGASVDERLVQGSKHWIELIKGASQEQNQRTQGGLYNELTPAKEEFQHHLDERAVHASGQLKALADTLHQKTQGQVSHAAAEESQSRDAVRQHLETMKQALEELAHLTHDAGETMVRGADAASDLMNATNVGARTVIGLFNNLKQIFNEIESAWA